MSRQDGFTLVELVVAVTILTFMSGLAVLSGKGFLTRNRISREASRFQDNIAKARERSVARYENWMIEFPAPAAGATAVTTYTVKTCALSQSTDYCNPDNAANWTASTIMAEPGVGFQVDPTRTDRLLFDSLGRLKLQEDLDVKICLVSRGSSGALLCATDGATTLHIHKLTGIIR